MDIYWTAVGTVGLEHLILQETVDGIQADGMVLRYHNESGLRLAYQISCDQAWRTRQVDVQLEGEGMSELSITADGSGNWTGSGGESLDYLQGCLDVDIMATPFTNTLAIRRLALVPGESREIDLAYITIPELQVGRSKQRYTCLERNPDGAVYLYESLDGDFRAELAVDSEGLVIDYQGIWVRSK